MSSYSLLWTSVRILKSIYFIFQVDLQAQARAHRIGQKRDVLVLRFETVSLLLFARNLNSCKDMWLLNLVHFS